MLVESCDEHENHKLIDTIDSFGEFEVNIQVLFVDFLVLQGREKITGKYLKRSCFNIFQFAHANKEWQLFYST